MLFSLQRFTVLFFLLAMPYVMAAQVQQPHDAMFGEIPDSVRTLEPPSDFPDAPYRITNKEVDVSFREANNSVIAVMDHHIRLKVFDPSDPEASIIAIPYYFENDMEQVREIEGITHRPNGERIYLRDEDIRTININARYDVKEFAMPAVEEGAILEYRYVIERRYIEELPDFFLAHTVPTDRVKMAITYPGYLRYESFVENFSGDLRHDVIFTDTSSAPKIFTVPQPDPIVTEQWQATDISPVQEEPYITTLNDYRGKIKFQLSRFGNPLQKLDNSWEVVVANMRRNTNPRSVAEQHHKAFALGDSIAQAGNADSKLAVQDSIFSFLNERVNFSGDYAPYSTLTDSDVLAGEPADQAAINQTLLAMLHGAGIKADPVMLSTRESGKINKDFPSFYQFNAQVVRSEIDGEAIYLDAAFPHSEPNLLPRQLLTEAGLVFGNDSFEWISPDPIESRFDIKVEIDAELESDGSLTGRVVARQQGYPAQQIRQQKADGMNDTEILHESLFDGYHEVSFQNVRLDSLTVFQNPIELRADFEISDYAQSFSDGLEFRPMIVGYRMENPFGDEQRDLPVTLDAPEQLDVSYSIKLPEGYRSESGRGEQEIGLEGASLLESYNLRQDHLEYSFRVEIGRYQFSTNEFPRLYDLYNRWVELSNTRWLIKN